MSDSILAYAKINLTLDIIGKREDGYHLLRMLMQSVSLCDRLVITEDKPGIYVECNREDVPCDESNTVYSAAAAFFRYSGKNPAVTVSIQKNIPSQAGLGGGSADAAAVLHALNRRYKTGYSVQTLCEIGVKVGADVPFCITGGTALVEGIGEKITRVPPLPHCYIVICKPPVGVNTSKAFALADAVPKSNEFTSTVLSAVRSGDLYSAASGLGNDFENVLCLTDVNRIKAVMKQSGALGACMTGSGSAVYGIFGEKTTAVQCHKNLLKEYTQVFLCEPIDSVFPAE